MATTESLERSSVDELAGPMTAEQFAEIAPSFELPVELVRGEIVEISQPKAPHGTICGLIFSALLMWAKETDAGIPSMADGVLTERGHDTLRAPDVMLIPKDRLLNGRAPQQQFYDVPPSLCVEVISDSESWHDIRTKIEEYFAFGVSEVWIVDQQLRTLLAFDSPNSSRKFVEGDVIETALLPGFAVPLSDFFYGC